MGLGIYTSADAGSKLSDGDKTNPLQLPLNGRTGDSIEKQLYLRSDSDVLTYSSITIKPVVVGVEKDVVTGVSGFSWKLKEGEIQPIKAEWDSISAGNTITIPVSLSSSGTYYPFWLKVIIPQNAKTNSFSHVILQINATET